MLTLLFASLPSKVNRRDDFYDTFGGLADVRRLIAEKYVEQVSDEVLYEGAINGMMQQLDRYSMYIPARNVDQFDRDATGRFPGVGIVLTAQDDKLVVVSPIEGTPAFEAGVMAGDRILEIDGISTASMNIQDAVERLTGKPGTEVTITVRRKDSDELLEIPIVRAEIRIQSVKGYSRNDDGSWNYWLDQDNGIAYIRITQYIERTGEELDAVVNELLLTNRFEGLIIDLRFNPGGLLHTAVQMADRFLSEGVIVKTRGRQNIVPKVMEAHAKDDYPEFSVVIIVSENTASAAEVFSGALKDHGRAVLVGTRTFGKGYVQTVYDNLPDGGAIKLTTDHYYLPSGRNINRPAKAWKRQGKDDADSSRAALWGVDPNVEVILSQEETIELQKSWMQADVISPHQTATQATTQQHPVTTQRALDRQLQAALKEMRTLLNLPATDTQPSDTAKADVP